MKFNPKLDGIKLLICDIDNTLADRDSDTLYPHVAEWFRRHPDINRTTASLKFALVTNQGGPACHDAGWSISDQFPSLKQVQDRLAKIVEQLPPWTTLHVCLAYVSKGGTVYIPKNHKPTDLVADPRRRKPSPIMIHEAMEHFNISNPQKVLYVGDRPEDKEAARRAGVRFHQVKDGVSL